MKAIQVKQYVSSPSELQVVTLPTPQPAPDKYLIKIHAAGTNFFDLLQIQGKYPTSTTFTMGRGRRVRW